MNVKRLLPISLAVMMTFIGAFAGRGATMTSTAAGGTWSSTSTWTGGVVPTSIDNAIIRAGASVTVTSVATVNSLVFSNNSASIATLSVNSGVTFTVTGGITNQNSATTNTAVLIQGAGTLTCTSLSIGGTTTPTPLNSAFTATLTSSISNLSVSGILSIKALYNSPQSAANQGTFALSSGAVVVGGSVAFVTVPLFGPTLTLATGSQNGTLTLSGATPFTFSGGGSSTFTPNGTNATVNYSGAAQTVQGATYKNLVLSGSGSKITTGVTVSGTLSRQGTATASAAPTYGTNSTLEYKGSAAQTTGPELTAGLANLTINNTNGVTAATSVTLTNTLTLVGGKLITGANQINLTTNGSVSGGSATTYVSGNLQKTFSVGSQTFTFPIGDSASYAPLLLANLSVTTSGSLKANVTGGDHPQIASSGLDSARSVNRYWTLTQSGGTFGTFNATFNYPAADVDASAAPAQFLARRWNGSAWSVSTISGTPSSTSTSTSGQSGFGDFAIGDQLPWFDGSWTYRKAIVIDHTRVTGNLTNFPVLISRTDSDLPGHAQTNANDLLFTSFDGTNKLAHEIESYISSNGTLVAWVSVPGLSSSTDTIIYLYYGNASAPGQQNATAVWDANFGSVWHLKENPASAAPQMQDSTIKNHDGTATNMVSGDQRAAKINGGVNFGGSNQYVQTSSTESKTNSNLTWECWFKAGSTTFAHHLMWQGTNIGNGFGDASPVQEMNLTLGDFQNPNQFTNRLAFFFGDTDYGRDTNVIDLNISFSDTNNWHHAAAVVTNIASSPGATLYLDGVAVASGKGTTARTGRTAWNTNLRLGTGGDLTRYYAGLLDEVRVSTAARSANWIATEFNNQNSPGTFAVVGSPEVLVATKLAITAVNGGSNAVVGTAFSVVIQAQGSSGATANVTTNTTFTLSLNAGSGSVGGTLTGTISNGTSSTTLTNVTYTRAESGVSLTATRTSGDNLAAANSSPFTVIPGNQTITFPSPGNQTYGVGPITLSATASSGLTVSYSVISGPANVAGSVLTITGAGSITIQASQSGNSNWNAAPTTNQTISVAQKIITGSITASNKVYDATVAATIATRTLSGVTNSDVVSLTGGVAAFANKNVGNGKTVIVTGLSLTGANATNYVLASTSATNTANITKATLTVSATGVNRVYDATTNATVTLSDNRVAGDGLTTSYTSASFTDKNVGNGKTVNVSGISVTGADSGNYAFNTTATATANITTALLTVTANNANRPYGTPNPSFTASYSGFASGEGTNVLSGSPGLSTTATTNSPVGNYPIQVDQGTLSSSNYSFSLNNGTLTVFEVPAVLTLSYVAGQTNHVDVRCAGLTPGSTYHLQASTNLAQWIEIAATPAAPDGTILFTDADISAHPVRFYRLSNQ